MAAGIRWRTAKVNLSVHGTQPVEVQTGPLSGVRGVVVYHKGRYRVVITVSALNNRAVAVEWLKGGSGKRGRGRTRPKIGDRGGAAIYGAVTLSSFMQIRAVNGALGKAGNAVHG